MRRAIEERDVIRIKMASTSKREGNDLSYVTKMGASGTRRIAAAFAVAFAVLVSVSSIGDGSRLRRIEFDNVADTTVDGSAGRHGSDHPRAAGS